MKKRKGNNKKVLIIGIIFIVLVYFFINNKYLVNKSLFSSLFRINYSFKESKSFINSEVSDLNKEITDLKKLNNLDKVYTDKTFISASITKRSMTYFHDLLTINKGKKDGVKEGYAVISSDGLIGKIEKVNNNTSEVKLISNLTISSKFEQDNNYYYGIIDKYNIINNELYMNNVIGDFNEKDIINKDVITSGLDNNIPSGLLIGKIIKVRKDKYNLSSTIVIKLSSNIDDINIVKVVIVK